MTFDELLGRFKGVKRSGPRKATALCPAHDDQKKNSLSLAETDDGHLLMRCFVGCSTDAITGAVQIRPADLFVNGNGGGHHNGHAGARRPRLTLEDFAAAKRIPVAVLAENGVLQESWGLQITYLERDGSPARQQRRRTALAAKDGSTWQQGAGSPIPYGRWRLDEAVERGELVGVEGETDTLTGWLHNVPTLGIPGADMVKVLQAEDLVGFERFYVVREPDRGGGVFVANVAARLRELAWAGAAYVVDLGVKDLNELHVTAGAAFAEQLEAAKRAATPIADSELVGDVTGPAWPLYDAADDWAFPPPQFAIEGLLPLYGTVWIGALPKRGKSLLVLYLCLAIACRRTEVARRFKIFAYPKILYLTREDGGSRVQERRDDICAAWGVRPERGALRFVIRASIDLQNPEHVAWLRETCVREERTLLVIDTWTALSPSADPMGPKDQAQLAAIVVQLAADIAGAVIVIDHSRKNRPEGQVLSSSDILGPSQKWASAEHIVMLDHATDRRRLEVFVESKDSDGERFLLAISPRGSKEEKFAYAGAVENLAEERRAIGDANRQAVLETLLANPEALSVGHLTTTLEAGGLRLSKDTVQRHLKALVKTGRVRQSGVGKDTRYFAVAALPQEPCAAEEGAAE
jgi:DNA-binding transcriptional ArsR family regulator